MARRLAFPIAVTPRGLATIEQDTEADIAQSVALLLSTRPGERQAVPDYGLPDPVFGGLNIADIYDAIEAWEPRADRTLVEQIVAGLVQEFEVTVDSAGTAAVATLEEV